MLYGGERRDNLPAAQCAEKTVSDSPGALFTRTAYVCSALACHQKTSVKKKKNMR